MRDNASERDVVQPLHLNAISNFYHHINSDESETLRLGHLLHHVRPIIMIYEGYHKAIWKPRTAWR